MYDIGSISRVTAVRVQDSNLRKPRDSMSYLALISRADPMTRERFLEFFTVNIRSPNTRPTPMGRAAAAFLDWCDRRGLAALTQVQLCVIKIQSASRPKFHGVRTVF